MRCDNQDIGQCAMLCKELSSGDNCRAGRDEVVDKWERVPARRPPGLGR
jgi:hypothetical protein